MSDPSMTKLSFTVCECCALVIHGLASPDAATTGEKIAACNGATHVESRLKEEGYNKISWQLPPRKTVQFTTDPCPVCHMPRAGARYELIARAYRPEPLVPATPRAGSLVALSFWSSVTSADIIAARDYLAGLPSLSPEEGDEIGELNRLIAEGENTITDWENGATLIRDSAFLEFAQEWADTIADSRAEKESRDRWPGSCIDWDRAAKELRTDYYLFQINGVTFWGFAG